MFVYIPYSESNSPRMGIGFHLTAIRYSIPQLFKKICIMQRQTSRYGGKYLSFKLCVTGRN